MPAETTWIPAAKNVLNKPLLDERRITSRPVGDRLLGTGQPYDVWRRRFDQVSHSHAAEKATTQVRFHIVGPFGIFLNNRPKEIMIGVINATRHTAALLAWPCPRDF